MFTRFDFLVILSCIMVCAKKKRDTADDVVVSSISDNEGVAAATAAGSRMTMLCVASYFSIDNDNL